MKQVAGLGRGGGERNEIYEAAFGGHLFYDLFLYGGAGGHGPIGSPGFATELTLIVSEIPDFLVSPTHNYFILLSKD